MRRKLALTLTCVGMLLLTACDMVTIDNLRDGQIVNGPTVHVTGALPNIVPQGGTLTVNGIPTPYGPNPTRSWAQDVPANTAQRTTEIDVVFQPTGGGESYRQRLSVVNGPSIPEGQPSPNGVGMRFTNTGLQGLGPVVKQLASGAFDIGSLLMAQNPIINNEPVFLTFSATGTVKEAGIGGVDIQTKSTTSGANALITIDNLYVGLDLRIRDGLAIDMTCGLELNIANTTINANFDLQPQAGSPSHVDVNLVGSPQVVTNGITYQFISGICDSDTFLLGDIVNSLAGPKIQGMVGSSFGTKLGDPDGAGPLDSPIADAIETALGNISIAGSVGQATKVNLDAPFTSITEGATAIDMRANADFYPTFGTGPTDCQPPARAPDLKETYDVPGAFPSLGDTTPSGQPYGLGLTISASAFNQLLSAMTECGLINRDITTVNVFGQELPVTSSLLAGFDPKFASIGPNVPMLIRVRPTVGPFVTEKPGPAGAMGELYLANLQLDFIQPTAATDIIHARVAVDSPLGLSLNYDPAVGQLAPTITPGASSDVRARVVANNIGVNEANIEALFPAIFPSFVGGLSSSFAAFPLPSFLGLKLDVKQVVRDGQYFVLYSDLTPVPQTRLENVVVTDLSTADSVVDSAFDVNEWRHKIRKTVTGSTASVAYKGMLGADACCTVDDEQKSAKAMYRMTFDVVPENGQTWHLNIGQSIAGAHTIKDEKVALEDAGGESKFVTPVKGRAKIGAGAWQNFDVTPSVMSVKHNLYGGEGTSNKAFSGSNSSVMSGTTRQTITIEFEVDLFVKSDSNAFFPAAGGDEVALRFGANDTIANGFTAGEYPGLGNRNILTDGHFANVVLTAT